MINLILIFAFVCYVLHFINGKKSTVLGCGLVGFSGTGEYNIDKIRTLLLWNSIKRGKDATGIFTPNSGILKNNSAAVDFLAENDIKGLKSDKILIGHVRAGTFGANNKNNAHPFKYGSVIVAHNGTLDNPVALGQKYGLKSNDWNVDSQTLANGLAKNYQETKDADGTYKTLGEFDGAAALIWYNEETGLLYAYHDKNRPLWYGWDASGNMYISSLKESLEATECYAVTEFEINTLYKIKDSQIVSQETYKTFLELNPPKPVVNNNNKGRVIELPTRTTSKAKEETASDLLGCNLRAKYNLIPGANSRTKFGAKLATITEGRYYKVIDVYKDFAYAVEIVDDNGELNAVFISNLDTDNYLPSIGSPVVIMESLFGTRKNVALWPVGTALEIDDVDYKRRIVKLRHSTYGMFDVAFGFIRTLTDDEEEEFFTKQYTDQNDLFSRHFKATNDLPWEADKEEEDLVPPVEEEDSNTPDLMELKDHVTFLMEINLLVNKLEDDFTDPAIDLSTSINLLRQSIKNQLKQTCLC